MQSSSSSSAEAEDQPQGRLQQTYKLELDIKVVATPAGT